MTSNTKFSSFIQTCYATDSGCWPLSLGMFHWWHANAVAARAQSSFYNNVSDVWAYVGRPSRSPAPVALPSEIEKVLFVAHLHKYYDCQTSLGLFKHIDVPDKIFMVRWLIFYTSRIASCPPHLNYSDRTINFIIYSFPSRSLKIGTCFLVSESC